LGGPWQFYANFYPEHGLCQLKIAAEPEIAVKAGTTLVVPLVISHDPAKPAQLNLTIKLPDGWNIAASELKYALPAESSSTVAVHVETPKLSAEQLKRTVPQEIHVSAEVDGKAAGEIVLKVALRGNGLPQSL